MAVSLLYKIFDVVPAPDEIWGILYDGQAMTLHANKDEAVKVARFLALQNRPSRLLIRAADGEIESETPFEIEGCTRAPAAMADESAASKEEQKRGEDIEDTQP